MHHAAQQVAIQGGNFPQTLEDLMACITKGRSTAGAILALACQQRGVCSFRNSQYEKLSKQFNTLKVA